MREDFFSQYLAFASGSEVPVFFHRWSAIAGIGAFLQRDSFIKFGSARIHPNIYSMLIGNPGTRKSSAIKLFKKLLVRAEYKTIAASKTTKEKFLLDLARIDVGTGNDKDFLDQSLFGDTDASPSCCFIMADEFNDFFGNNNLEFISLLGSLWDWEGGYENRIKNGKSFVIPDPTISILGGNTPTGFSAAFPPEIIGQGFFSRLLLVYGEPTGVKIAFPVERDDSELDSLVLRLHQIKAAAPPEYILSTEARQLLEKIYRSWEPISDVRFESYSNRRFTHLLKLCMIHSAAALNSQITVEDAICANTILAHTEYLMPKALGEFGKAKNSDVAQKVMSVLDAATMPLSHVDLWRHVSSDLDKMNDLWLIIQNLQQADKIQNVGGKFLPKRKQKVAIGNGLIDVSYLTEEERSMTR